MSIRIACHPNSYGRFGVEGALEMLASAGIRWIELPVKTSGVASPFGESPVLTNASSDREVEAVATRVRDAGLSICSANITSGNPLKEDVTEITLRKLELSALLGVGLVVAGGGEFSNSSEEQHLLDNLNRIGDAAARLGMVYCCETHPGACQNAASMQSLMQRMNHPAIRLNFDTANILYYNECIDLFDELQRVLPWVGHVHLKDSLGRFQEWNFPALGDGGAVDFARLWEMLSAAGYTGPCSLEIEGIQGELPLSLAEHHDRVQRSLRHLRSRGYPC